MLKNKLNKNQLNKNKKSCNKIFFIHILILTGR